MQVQFHSGEFPAITVCNLNPYKYSRIKEVDNLRELVNAFLCHFSENLFRQVEYYEIHMRRERTTQERRRRSESLYMQYIEGYQMPFRFNSVLFRGAKNAFCSDVYDIDVDESRMRRAIMQDRRPVYANCRCRTE